MYAVLVTSNLFNGMQKVPRTVAKDSQTIEDFGDTCVLVLLRSHG